MYLFKNAMKNLGRNKGRNIIVGIVMVSVLALSSISLVINATSDKIKDAYKEMYGSEVFVQADIEKLIANGTEQFLYEELTNEQAEKLKKSESLKETKVIYGLSALSSTTKPIEVEDDSEATGNIIMNGGGVVADFKIRAYSDLKFMTDFEKGTRKLLEGRMSEGKNEALVSKEFAELNKLKLGDTFKMGYAEDKSEMELTVAGIFLDTVSNNLGFIPFAEMNPKNEIIVSEETLLDYMGTNEWGYKFYTFYLKNPDLLKAFNDEAHEIGMSENLMMATDTGAYQQMVGPLEGVAKTSMNMLWLILIFGSGLVVLMSVLSVRERKYEVGVLRAIGMKKKQLMKTFLYESLVIMIACLMMGMGVGGLMAKPVSNMMLEQQKSSPQTGIIGSISVGGPAQEELDIGDVQFSTKAFLQVSAVGLLIALVSTSVGVVYVMRYEPMEILSERN